MSQMEASATEPTAVHPFPLGEASSALPPDTAPEGSLQGDHDLCHLSKGVTEGRSEMVDHMTDQPRLFVLNSPGSRLRPLGSLFSCMFM